MTSPESSPAPSASSAREADTGLLAPGRPGTPVAAATGDLALLQALLDAETALTAALGAPHPVRATLARAARAERFDPYDLATRAYDGGNPVIPLVADLRAAVDEDTAAWVHRGATSQDILDTALMLLARRARTHLLADLDTTAAHLHALAHAHRATPMAGRTLTQHAVPTTFGLKAAGWRHLVLDARDRLAGLRLPVQLGGAAGTLAALGADPALLARYAEATGLDTPLLPWHVLRTPVAELGAALALTGGALGKLAADVLLLTRTETGELSEGTGGASSAMPHKSNPVRATLVAATARQLPYHAAQLYGSLVAEDERPAGAWHAEWQTLREALRLAGTAAHEAAALTADLRAHPARMRANLGLTGGLIASEHLLAALAPHTGRAAARTLLTAASRTARAQDRSLADVLAEHPSTPAEFTPELLRHLLDPAAHTGAAPALTDRALRRTALDTP
ncbi:lyase family protein [Streptomyces sp. NPDC001054]